MASHRTSDGTKLFYQIRGEGRPPLVLVHGWCSNLRHWAAQTRSFSKRHRVLALDRRGHGRTGLSASGYSVRLHAQDLEEVARKERIRGAIVVAHAGGAPTAMKFAVDSPERVRALILIDTTIGPRSRIGDPADLGGAAFGAMIETIRGEQDKAQPAKQSQAPGLAGIYAQLFSPHAGPIARDAVASAVAMPTNVVVEELTSLAINTEALARRIKQPVLWLSVAAADTTRLSSLFRSIQFGQCVGSGHFPHLEVPEQTNAMIARFIATL